MLLMRVLPLRAASLTARYCCRPLFWGRRCPDTQGWTKFGEPASRMLAAVRRGDSLRKRMTSTESRTRRPRKIVSRITINYSSKPAPRPPVTRRNGDAVNRAIGQRRCCFQLPAISAGHLNPLGDVSMSKRIALFSAAAVAPVSAQDKMKSEMSGEKTVMVGGAAMFPSKNIIQNAVHSKDHTTLVAAVKAAGLVETLEGKGPFTVFAPTNIAFGKLPAGTVDGLVKPENKATLTKILTYHVVPGKLEASSLTDGKKLKTVEGEELTVKHQDGKVWIVDAKGGTSMVTIANVNQSNGVIHVVDTVLMPAS